MAAEKSRQAGVHVRRRHGLLAGQVDSAVVFGRGGIVFHRLTQEWRPLETSYC